MSSKSFRRRLVPAVAITALALSVTGFAGADRGPGGGGPAQSEDGLVVQDLDHGSTAAGLAQSLVGGGVTISNVTYTGANDAAGSFIDTGPGTVVGFDSGVVLGSGSVQTLDGDNQCSKGVEGPNQCDGNTTINGTPGDADLDTLSGKTTFDAAVLEFDFVPQFSTVQFTYVFSSDEYNEFSNTTFNDTFGFLINGQNCALVPGTTTPVGVNTINGGNPFGTNAQHPELFRNNDLDDGGGSINTEMDGLTVALTCDANVNAGVTNHMKLAIADASDTVLDSNVFIQAGSLVSGTQIATSLSGGGQTGTNITVPSGTPVTDQATLSGAHAGTAGGTVKYTVYTGPGCTTVYGDGGTKTVTNGVVPASDPVTLTGAGTYNWVASYSGDPGNNAAESGCADEVATVQQANHAPVCPDDSFTTPQNTAHNGTLTCTDADGDSLTYSAVGNPAHGMLVVNANGSFTYTPNAGYFGPDSFTYNATDGKDPSNTATVSVTVTAGDTTPPTCDGFSSGKVKNKDTYTFVIQDTGSGLKSVDVVQIVNSTWTIPAFTVGTTSQIKGVETAIKSTKHMSLTILITDVAGNQTVCDPLVTTVRARGKLRGGSHPVAQTFALVPQYESKLRIFNGRPGLTRLRVTVNGRVFSLKGLRPGQSYRFDLAKAMRPGNANTITLRGYGRAGASARIELSNLAFPRQAKVIRLSRLAGLRH